MKIKVFFFTFCFFCSLVKANILIEPYLGRTFSGEGDMSTGLGSLDVEYASLVKGIRLGYEYAGLMLGADYSLSDFKLENRSLAFNRTNKDKVSRNDLGFFVGFNLPMALRFWATWIFQAKLDGDEDSNARIFSKNTTFEGDGQSFGIGLSLLPLLSINLEYTSVEYDEYKTTAMQIGSYNDTLDLSHYILSLSMPISF